MRTLILAAALACAAGAARADGPLQVTTDPPDAVGQHALANVTVADHIIASGRCAAASLQSGSHDIAVGDYTAIPDGAIGFVNIHNRLCFWRATGEHVACPPPEPECVPDHP